VDHGAISLDWKINDPFNVCICYVQIWERNMSDHDETRARIQSLPDALLIQILQHHDFDDDITRMVEAEIARRKLEGRQQ
jgi:hypothetical protein